MSKCNDNGHDGPIMQSTAHPPPLTKVGAPTAVRIGSNNNKNHNKNTKNNSFEADPATKYFQAKVGQHFTMTALITIGDKTIPKSTLGMVRGEGNHNKDPVTINFCADLTSMSIGNLTVQRHHLVRVHSIIFIIQCSVT